MAKLGLFSINENRVEKRDGVNRFVDHASSDKLDSAEPMSFEQRIASLMSSGDGLGSSTSEDSVPELPGNHLS